MKKYLLIFISVISFGGFYFRPSLAAMERVPTGEVGTPPTDCKVLWWKGSTHPTCSQKKFCGAYLYEGLQTFESQAECLGQVPSPATIPVEPAPPQSLWERVSKTILFFMARIFSIRSINQISVAREGTLFLVFRRGPVHPICSLNDQPCDAPAADFPFQISAKNSPEILLSAKSDQAGRYQTQLRPGQYVLEYQPSQVEKYSRKGQEFTVTAGQTTTINIGIDTGIR